MTQTFDRERPVADPEGAWTAIGAAGELAPGAMRTVKRGVHQLVLGRTEDGRPFALDNRCPHEGYPLAQGTLKGDALTCCWHNWKFDVRDGACLLGGEPVRRYPVREHGGALEVDLSEPDPAVEMPRLRASFEEALREHDNGRALRDAARMILAGLDPWRLLAEVAAHDARHSDSGCGHTLAVAADCGRVLDRHPGVRAIEAIAPAIDMCGEANQRLGPRWQPAPIAGATAGELRRAVEEEDAERAEGLLLGAFDAGVSRAEIERWLYAVLSDHFLDFGHELIYLVKAQELLARLDDDRAYARTIHPALLHAIVLGTREDTLPYMRAYGERLRAVEDELPAVWASARADAPFDPAALRDAVLDGSVDEAFRAVWEPLRAGVPAARVARALVAAAAHRFWRFDVAIDADPDVVEGWLWATHRFTFASAVRNAVERFASPDALRFLFQALAFVHSGRRLDRPAGASRDPAPEASDLDGILAAARARDAERATARLAGYLRDGGSVDALRVAVEDLCLSDPLVRPIVVVHAIKTCFAAFEEHVALAGDPDRDRPLLAAVRMLASPIVERRVRETAIRSARWVAEGRMPRKLTQ